MGESKAERPYWVKTGYRDEWACPHGIGHGIENPIHSCCAERCCQRDDYPLKAELDALKAEDSDAE